MDKMKPEVGQKLYSLNIGNAARRREQKLTIVIVDKVGSKYFYVTKIGHEWSDGKYNLSDWREKADFVTTKLYIDPQEWEDEKEGFELLVKIKNHFEKEAFIAAYRNGHDIDLEKLRKINAILES